MLILILIQHPVCSCGCKRPQVADNRRGHVQAICGGAPHRPVPLRQEEEVHHKIQVQRLVTQVQ